MLVEGVGPKKAKDVMAALVKSDNPYDTLREMTGRSGKGLRDLALTLESLAGAGDLRPAEQVNHIYEYYLPILKTQYDDYPKRMRDLDHLQTIAEGYQGVETFLRISRWSRRMGVPLAWRRPIKTTSDWCCLRSILPRGLSGNVYLSSGLWMEDSRRSIRLVKMRDWKRSGGCSMSPSREQSGICI